MLSLIKEINVYSCKNSIFNAGLAQTDFFKIINGEKLFILKTFLNALSLLKH